MKIAGTDCRPCIVNKNYFGMDIDIASFAMPILRCDPNKREILILAERCQLFTQLVVRHLVSQSAPQRGGAVVPSMSVTASFSSA
jgi:hypothetical protein